MKYRLADGLCALGILAAIMIVAGTATAASSTVAYQGVLRTAGGPAVADGVYDMAFSIWDAVTAGTELWAESHAAVSIADGEFAVLLGEATAFGTLFTDHASLWLQIAVDTSSGMEVYNPRIPLTSVPYAKAAPTAVSADTAADAAHASAADTAANATHAITADSATTAGNATNAANAATLGGQPASYYADASHSHDASHINAGTLSTDRYSAYADLGAESKIGAGAAQVAAGDHRHDGLPFWVGQVGGELSGTKTLYQQDALAIPVINGNALMAPVAGRYYIHYQQLTGTAGSATYLSMRHNGNIIGHAWMNSGHWAEDLIVDSVVNMNAGDQITFTVDVAVQASAWGGAHSSVSMFLIGQP